MRWYSIPSTSLFLVIDSWALSFSLGSFQSNQQSLCDVSFLQVDNQVKYRKRETLVLYTNVPTRKCTKQLSLQLIYSWEIVFINWTTQVTACTKKHLRSIYMDWTENIVSRQLVQWARNSPRPMGWLVIPLMNQIKWTGPAHSAPYPHPLVLPLLAVLPMKHGFWYAFSFQWKLYHVPSYLLYCRSNRYAISCCMSYNWQDWWIDCDSTQLLPKGFPSEITNGIK